MDLAPSLSRYFQQRGITVSVHPHVEETSLSKLCQEMGVEPGQMAVPIMLRSRKQAGLMAVVPMDHSLDLDRLMALLRREFSYMDSAESSAWFVDAEPGAEPAVAEPYGIPCIIDRSLFQLPRLFMRAGSHRALISLDADNLRRLYQSCPKAVIANPSQLPADLMLEQQTDPASINSIYTALDQLQRLPAIPAMAPRLMQLVSDPETPAAELAATIELDPSVTAQVLRYARSPYFGYRGRLDSVRDAITRVLGFELVGNIALGIVTGRAFDVPQTGPLGLRAFWKHALYTAVLAQSLAKKFNQPGRLHPAQAYLCGLLHNLGQLVMGHLFPREFSLLNHEYEHYSQCDLATLERELVLNGDVRHFIRLGHDHLGGYLLEKWRLPGPVVACAQFHHATETECPEADYVALIRLCNRLLAQRGIGDMGAPQPQWVEDSELLPWAVAEQVLNRVMELCPELDQLADSMVA